MIITTLCYIEHKNHYLMLHRTKKAADINEGKWIGVGGKFREGESPDECLVREVFEETGYRLRSWRFRGIITFIQENYETEYMCLYTSDDFALGDGDVPVSDCADFSSGDSRDWPVPDCDEGDLAWIPVDEISELNLWPGDRIFLKLLGEQRDFFSLKLVYKGNDLLEATLDGEVL